MGLLLKRSFLTVAVTVMLFILTGCGGTATTTSSYSASSTPTPTEAQSTPTPTATATTVTGAALVKTVSATIDGKAVTILTDGAGKTLYYFTPDTEAVTACTGSCASAWPPLLFTGVGVPVASEKLPVDLAVKQNENGKQVTYNGHPLYTFSGDTAAGQTSGQGLNGKWYVATPDLARLAGNAGKYSYKG